MEKRGIKLEDYKVGTIIISPQSGDIFRINNRNSEKRNGGLVMYGEKLNNSDSFSENCTPFIKYEGIWAEIVSQLEDLKIESKVNNNYTLI